MTNKQIDLLNKILDMIIPRSEKFDKPSGAEVNFIEYVDLTRNKSWITEGLEKITLEIESSLGVTLSEINLVSLKEKIDQTKKSNRHFYNSLTKLLVECYYQDNQVVSKIGLGSGTPFPEGYEVIMGDLALLEPVFLRGKIYKDTPSTKKD